MVSVGLVLKLSGRATIWRMTSDPHPAGLASLLIIAAALVALRVALQFVSTGADADFNAYGLNAVIAWLALETAIAALLIPAAWRTTALAAMLVLLLIAEFIIGTISIAFSRLPPVPGLDAFWLGHFWPTAAIFVCASIWWIGAMTAVMRSVVPGQPFAAFGRVVALWAALIALTVVVPHEQVFVADGSDVHTANVWDYLFPRHLAREEDDEAPAADATATIDQSQRELLKAQIDRLAPAKQDGTSIYALGVAGWADQDVFLKEMDGGLAALGGILPIQGHTLRLVNHRETTESAPLANQRNFAAAVHDVGAVMNKDADILVLLMTSHGTPSGFALRLPNEVTSELTPQEVAGTLAKEGIKNRIVIVSACYSGTFIPPLANDDTIVLTASDAKNASFGCAPERDWTYFGDAFFRQSLRPGWDLQHAFDNARVLISGWELMDRAPPSNPQGHFGPALVGKLAPYFASAATARQ
jgi:peptidase C13-like protein